jgi:hypothetical protein
MDTLSLGKYQMVLQNKEEVVGFEREDDKPCLL